MLEPLSVSALLTAAGTGIAKGIGQVATAKAVQAWRSSRRVASASKKARAAAVARHRGWPGVERALDAWASSPAFDNLVLDAALGETDRLGEGRVVRSFVANGGAGWPQDRAAAVTATFLTALFDELAKGEEGQALALRLDEARERQARAERGEIHDEVTATRAAAEVAAANTQDLNATLQEVTAELRRVAPSGEIPAVIETALQDGVFEEVSRHFEADEADLALALADRFSERIEGGVVGDGERYADALRPYRQRLFLAAANAASYLLDTETARARARSALDLGPVDDRLHPQAVQALFNASLPDDLRRLAARLDPGSRDRERAEALLAFLDGDWDTAADRLAALDALALQAQAEVARLDPSDPDAVRRASGLLDHAAREADTALGALASARTTVHLLTRVLDGRTPLEFDRRPLVDAAIERALDAVDRAPDGSAIRAHAASALADLGLLLADTTYVDQAWAELRALPPEAGGRAVFALDRNPSPDEVAEEVAAGRISPAQAAVRNARTLFDDGDASAAIAALREGLFQTRELGERVQVLSALVEALRGEGRDDEADAAIDTTPVPDAVRWRLAQHPSRPLDLDGARAFPLDPRVLRLVATRLLAETPALESTHERDLFETGRAVAEPTDVATARPSEWTRQLVRVLPTRSARLLHTEALVHDAEYDDLLAAAADLDAVFDPRPVELRAFALQGLGRLAEAAETMTAAARSSPDVERVAVNAAALWLAVGQGENAAALLEPFVEDATAHVGSLANYATALRQINPADREAAGRAFDLYRRAYEIEPSSALAGRAWAAARVAGRESEAGALFQAMTAGADDVVIESVEDARLALTADREAAFTRFTGDVDAFLSAVAERVQADREASDTLNRIAGAHAIADADAFRVSGQPWENWARRTLAAQRRPGGEGYGVLADWPSASQVHGRRLDPAPAGFYADVTALLTLGVLGPDVAARLLDAAAPVHVPTGTLDDLARERLRLEHAAAFTGAAGDVAAVARLDGTDAVVPYDPEVEVRAPEAPELGPARVDLGVAADLGGVYVSDLDRTLPDGARDLAVTSATLLQTLHYEGRIDRDAAEAAARAHPSTFGGWSDAEPLPEPPAAAVLDRFALSAWASCGLLDALGPAVRVGPWAWSQLAGEARQREAATAAYHRLRDLLPALRAARDAGHLVEVDPVGPPGGGGENEASDGDPDTADGVEAAWRNALRAVRTAQDRGLHLWADDRFYALLLWIGGPTITGPGTDAVLQTLGDAGERPLPIPTVDLSARLARDGRLDERDAQEIAATLFDHGYRPAHPLVLDDALRRFPVPSSPPLRPPLSALVESVRAIPTYLPEDLGLARRQGFARAAAVEVGGQFVLSAWTHPGLDDPQRRVLADAFLDAIESVFAEQSPVPDAPRADRTRLLFWRGLASTLFTAPFEGDDEAERRDAALRWLGDAAARRPAPLRDVVRLLEDNASTAVTLTPDADEIAAALASAGRDDVDPAEAHARAAGGFAFRALVPLLGSRLIEDLDPLLRRTVGWLGRLDRRGRIDSHVGAVYGGRELSTTVPEEDDEAAAIGLIRRVGDGDVRLAESVRATDLVFGYRRRPPEDWVAAGVPPDAGLPIEVRVSMFTLLWTEAMDIHPALVYQLVYQLSRIDPPLALTLLDVRDDLLGDDDALRDAARDALAFALLQSGFFELQRDLGHGVWRLRNGSADRLARFLGWVGDADARRLAAADADTAAHVVPIGDVLVSQAHFFGRRLLTDTFSDRAAVLAAVGASLEDPVSGPIPDLREWARNRLETAETTDDPFVAAYALRHVLLAFSAGFGDAAVADRAAAYLATTLSEVDPSAGALERHVELRRRLAQSSLLLSAFAAHGPEHLDVYNQEPDPLQEWLDAVWLLASRLLDALPALHGSLDIAVAEAERAVADLGLDDSAARVLDAFDPFLLAAEGVGRPLTLVAVRSSLDSESDGLPAWWSPRVEVALTTLAEEPTAGLPPVEDLGDRFSLGAPLRKRDLARSILVAVPTTNRPSDDAPPSSPGLHSPSDDEDSPQTR